MTEEQDREAIEKAASNHFNSTHRESVSGYSFKAVVAWRDANPGPKVLALVEALEKYASAEYVDCKQRYYDSQGDEQVDEWGADIARDALKAFRGED